MKSALLTLCVLLCAFASLREVYSRVSNGLTQRRKDAKKAQRQIILTVADDLLVNADVLARHRVGVEVAGAGAVVLRHRGAQFGATQ